MMMNMAMNTTTMIIMTVVDGADDDGDDDADGDGAGVDDDCDMFSPPRCHYSSEENNPCASTASPASSLQQPRADTTALSPSAATGLLSGSSVPGCPPALRAALSAGLLSAGPPSRLPLAGADGALEAAAPSTGWAPAGGISGRGAAVALQALGLRRAALASPRFMAEAGWVAVLAAEAFVGVLIGDPLGRPLRPLPRPLPRPRPHSGGGASLPLAGAGSPGGCSGSEPR